MSHCDFCNCNMPKVPCVCENCKDKPAILSIMNKLSNVDQWYAEITSLCDNVYGYNCLESSFTMKGSGDGREQAREYLASYIVKYKEEGPEDIFYFSVRDLYTRKMKNSLLKLEDKNVDQTIEEKCRQYLKNHFIYEEERILVPGFI